MSIIEKYKKVYFVGIGGIGVSSLARLFFYNRVTVVGSDLNQSIITKDLEEVGIKVNYKQIAENIEKDVDLVIYSSAVPQDNPELVRAKELKIETQSYFDFLGSLSGEYETIAISGTHGKSTTTAMLGLIMAEAGFDPTVILGTQVKGFDHNVRVGQGKHLILEACEYRGHMLKIESDYSLVNNAEEDHLDFYKDLDEIVSYFSKFLNQAKQKAFVNIDDKKLAQIAEYNLEYVTYGIDNNKANFSARDIKVENEVQSFKLFYKGTEEDEVNLKLPGRFNVYNALGAISVAHTLGVNFKYIKSALEKFAGCWRRFENVGQTENGALVISDYAHHPTAVKETIGAVKEFYKDKRLLVVFQPHQHSRTIKLFDDFVKAFSQADELILSEIYNVKGRSEESDEISSQKLIDAIVEQKAFDKDKVFYASNLETSRRKISELDDENTVILIMGAGDIDNVARQLVK